MHNHLYYLCDLLLMIILVWNISIYKITKILDFAGAQLNVHYIVVANCFPCFILLGFTFSPSLSFSSNRFVPFTDWQSLVSTDTADNSINRNLIITRFLICSQVCCILQRDVSEEQQLELVKVGPREPSVDCMAPYLIVYQTLFSTPFSDFIHMQVTTVFILSCDII